MSPFARRRPSVRMPFQVTLVGLVLPLVLGTGLLVSWVAYRRGSAMLISAGDQLLRALDGQLDAAITVALDPQRTRMGLERLQSIAGPSTLAGRLAVLPRIEQALAQSPTLRAYFIGFDDGQCLLVARVSDAFGRRLPGLPPQAFLVVESIAPDVVPGVGMVRPSGFSPSLRHQQLLLDARMRPLRQQASRSLMPLDFDPRRRPWYRLARKASGPVLSPVHRLALGQQLGLTLSRRLADGRGVVGASMELGSLEGLLERHRPTPGSHLAIVDGEGLVLVSNRPMDVSAAAQPEPLTLDQLGVPPSQVPGGDLAERVGRGFISRRHRGEDWRTAVMHLPSAVPGKPLYLVVAVPDKELLAGARLQQREGILFAGGLLVLLVPVVLLVAGGLSRELRRLAAMTAAIRRFEFHSGEPLRSIIQEVDDLSLTLESMRGTVKRFLDISAMLAAEDDVDRLLEKLLVESIAAAGARAGALYLPVVPAGSSMAAAAPGALPGFAPQLFHRHGEWQEASRLAALDAAAADALLGGPCGRDRVEPLPESPCLVLLLEDRQQVERIGLMLLWFEVPPEAAQEAFCRALSGSAAVALETRELIAAQKRLFEAFIQLIAGAIDAKSPYTGGHCARVPELTKRLAEAACEAREGPFAAFSLDA
ncbi:MAG: hypothetical protein ACKO0M_11455 [Cyanobium sp.]